VLPYSLGAHWFAWRDEPVLGRMDGENYNIGFVDAATVLSRAGRGRETTNSGCSRFTRPGASVQPEPLASDAGAAGLALGSVTRTGLISHGKPRLLTPRAASGFVIILAALLARSIPRLARLRIPAPREALDHPLTRTPDYG